MKILLSNYRYYVSGGPERYLFNVQKELQSSGHETIPFSIHYNMNEETPFSKYFVEPIGTREEVYFDQQRWKFTTFLRTLSRLFYSFEVERAVERLIHEHRPDVAYVLHYLRKMSPSLLCGIKKMGIPIVVRLSDFTMLCPQAHCLRENTPCTLCCNGNLSPSVKYRCVKDSLPASLLNKVATWFHNFKGFFDLIDIFVTTNDFMTRLMLEAGCHESRITCIPTFTDTEVFKPADGIEKSDYIIFFGRFDQLKGVHVLIDGFHKIKNRAGKETKLIIAGTGPDEYAKQIKDQIHALNLQNDILFPGKLDARGLSVLISRAFFSVIPSLWFENLPNALIESFACGTPVIASDIGSLAGCIDEAATGFLFETGNPDSLAEKMNFCLENRSMLNAMATKARKIALERYSAPSHINDLTALFQRLS